MAHPLHNNLDDDDVRRTIDARPRPADTDEALVRDTARAIQTVVEVGAQLAHVASEIRSKRPLQSVAVTGRLLCDGEPANDVELRLYDHDTFTPNDFMASNRTNEEGRFLIAGSEREFTRITPQLDIFHTCSESEGCLRKLTLYVPKSHVTHGEPPKKVFDFGSVELSGNFAGQSDECFE